VTGSGVPADGGGRPAGNRAAVVTGGRLSAMPSGKGKSDGSGVPGRGGDGAEVAEDSTQVVEYAAAIDVAKSSGMVCTRVPRSRPPSPVPRGGHASVRASPRLRSADYRLRMLPDLAEQPVGLHQSAGMPPDKSSAMQVRREARWHRAFKIIVRIRHHPPIIYKAQPEQNDAHCG
jgi:hypothetical protein